MGPAAQGPLFSVCVYSFYLLPCVLYLSCLFYTARQDMFRFHCSRNGFAASELEPRTKSLTPTGLTGRIPPSPVERLVATLHVVVAEAPGHFLCSLSSPWSVRLGVQVWLLKLYFCKWHSWWGCAHEIDFSAYSLGGKRIDSDWPTQLTTWLETQWPLGKGTACGQHYYA